MTATRHMAEFIVAHGITLSSGKIAQRSGQSQSHWGPGSTHWICTFKRGRSFYSTEYSQGSAHHGLPDPDDVLQCLKDDVLGVVNHEDFADWASDYGYGSDSHEARLTYAACCETSMALLRFFGPALFAEFLDVESD